MPRHHLQLAGADTDVSQTSEREYDTWLYLLKNKGTVPKPCAGSKAQKDDKTRLEEQQTTIDDLRNLVDRLVSENEQLKRETEQLRAENARLKKESYADTDFVERSELWVLPQTAKERKAKDIPIPQLPPLEMPTQEIPLEDLPGLELPEDIQQELQELLDGEKLWSLMHQRETSIAVAFQRTRRGSTFTAKQPLATVRFTTSQRRPLAINVQRRKTTLFEKRVPFWTFLMRFVLKYEWKGISEILPNTMLSDFLSASEFASCKIPLWIENYFLHRHCELRVYECVWGFRAVSVDQHYRCWHCGYAVSVVYQLRRFRA